MREPSPPTGGGAGRRFATEDRLGRDETEQDAALLGLDDEEGGDAPAGHRSPDGLAPDRLAWFRHGWLGPLAVAVTLALVALGVYVLLGGRDGSTAQSGSLAPSSPAAPVGLNPAAKVGKALVDGSYSCQAAPAGAAPPAGATAAAATTSVLTVPATSGTYIWNGQSGNYTIETPNYDDASNIIASVSFTSGPLQGNVATSIAGWPKGGGRVTATVTLTKGNSMFCKLN
jgi:hypothetical protein